MKTITITVGDIQLSAELNDSQTSRKIFDALPIEGRANVWGDEIYFDIGINSDLEPNARENVEVGELGYWPAGTAFCIFYGPTPVSTGTEPRAASPVNVLGRVSGDATVLRGTRHGTDVIISKANV